MPGLGTIINVAAIVLAGICGHYFGKILNDSTQNTLEMTCGISVILIGIAGVLEKMFKISDGLINAEGSMFFVICLVLGAFLGELIGIESAFERFGEWLKIKSGNASDKTFVDAFVTASLTVSIGAMAIVGSIQDGILGDYSILAIKSLLDFIIIMVMTSSLGKGAAFSAISVGILQGTATLCSKLIEPFMTTEALNNLSMVGSALIFCVGINLVFGKKIKVANLLPSIVFAVVFTLI